MIRLFYVSQVKRFVLLGFAAGVVLSMIARFMIRGMVVQEVAWHVSLRNQLGHPFAYYSQLALLLLAMLYELGYGVLGGLIGYLFFRLKHRHSGFSVFFTRTFKTGGAIVFLLLFYLFLRVDLVNQYDTTIMSAVPHPTMSQFLSTKFVKTLSYLFLPSMLATPEGGFSNHNAPTTQSTGSQPNQTYQNQPGSPTQPPTGYTPPGSQIFVPIPTSAGQPLPPGSSTSGGSTTPQSGGGLPSANELLAGLNSYRQQHGVSTLQWDGTLAHYAQQRADFYVSRGSIDGGAGFRTFKAQDGPFALGFQNIGELSNYGVSDTAYGLFANYFASFASTNSVQLSAAWIYAGIGVNGTAIEVVFGQRKCVKVERAQCY